MNLGSRDTTVHPLFYMMRGKGAGGATQIYFFNTRNTHCIFYLRSHCERIKIKAFIRTKAMHNKYKFTYLNFLTTCTWNVKPNMFSLVLFCTIKRIYSMGGVRESMQI